jgi:uncharacterized protein (TIGR03083 family)
MTPSSRHIFLATAQAYADFVADLVVALPPEAWARPGLGEWTCRDLVGHTMRSITTVSIALASPVERLDLVGPEDYYAAVSTVDHAAVAQRGREAAAALGADPAGAVRSALAQARADLDAVPAGADPLVRTALGGMRLSAYLSTRTIELVVHGGDLARAVGVPFEAPEEALTEVVAILGAVAVRRRLAQPLLAAMTGRERLPEGFTVL